MRKHSYRYLTAIILVLAMMLVGCGPQQGTVVPGTSQPEQETVENETTAPETTEPEATDPAQDTTEPEVTEPEAPSDGKDVSLGRMEGGTYQNSYAGIACDLDDAWTFYSAEELQELPENVKELFKDTEAGDSMENLSQINDMKAENADLMATVNVLYTKMDMTSRLAYQLLSEEDVLDSILAEKDTMISSYTQVGINVSSLEKVKVTFLGEEHWALKTVGEAQGAAYYVLQVFNYKLGAYGVTLTCSSFVEDQTQAILDLFYPVD